MMDFHKYHALGNDYIVRDPAEVGTMSSEESTRLLCHRHFGIGSDGILWGPIPAADAVFASVPVASNGSVAEILCGLRIFNPDGSEAEKSGNGLRIFCRYLWDIGRVKGEPFSIITLGGIVQCQVLDNGAAVRVEMGQVSFHSKEIPMSGEPREVINEPLQVAGRDLQICAATIGNPHCIVLQDHLDRTELQALGPLLEVHACFPKRTNVQFMQVKNRTTLAIEIWERGAGYTLASGSSASACAAVARRLKLCDPHVTVQMPGGNLDIAISDAFDVVLTGPVTAVAHGVLADELRSALDEQSHPAQSEI